jgi:hypothetical protein
VTKRLQSFQDFVVWYFRNEACKPTIGKSEILSTEDLRLAYQLALLLHRSPPAPPQPVQLPILFSHHRTLEVLRERMPASGLTAEEFFDIVKVPGKNAPRDAHATPR